MLDSSAPPPLAKKHNFFRKHAVKLVASADADPIKPTRVYGELLHTRLVA